MTKESLWVNQKGGFCGFDKFCNKKSTTGFFKEFLGVERVKKGIFRKE